MNCQIPRVTTFLLFALISFQNIFAQYSQSDTLTINELIETADSIMINNPKEAKILVDSAMVIANFLDIEKFTAKSIRRRIDAYYYLGRYSKAVEDLFQLLSYYEALKDSSQISSCYNDIGTTYSELAKYDLALEYLYKSLKMSKHNKEEKFKATVIGNIGYAYFYIENYTDAHKYFDESLKLCLEIDYQEGIATTNSNIGKTYIKENKDDLALPHFTKALKIYKEIDQQDGIAMVLNYLGIIEYHSKKYKNAITYFQESANIRERMGYFNGYILAINNIAFIYNLQGKPQKALKLYQKALSKADNQDDKSAKIVLLTNINKLYATLGDYKEAYKTLKENSLLKDDVYNTKKSEQIEELKIEFETEQKEREIANLKEVTEQRQMIIFLLVGSLALIGLVGYFGISRYRMKTQQSSMELEQRLLRSQMNPHFIFNSLSVIQGYIFKGSAKEAASYLSNFGKLMRSILENSREEYVMLDKEIETLNHYLELQNLRHGGKISYSVDISENLDTDSVRIPPMLAQPFIENSIKHGMNENGEVSIIVKYLKTENNMKLIIEDNGIGINKSQNGNDKSNGHKSLSISITEERLQLLSKRAKNKFKLSIVDISEKDKNISGTRVEVELPYIEEF